ncbi:DUF4232 domain-containing protein [Enterobacteriaceae bacterium LUAb1]
MMIKKIVLFFATAIILLQIQSTQTVSAASETPHVATQCQASQLKVFLDDGNGEFDGMSHSGVHLNLRNISRQTCTLSALPDLTFADQQYRSLQAERRSQPGMHPGPVLLPISLAPGQRVQASLRWVSSNVYDNGKCLTPSFIQVNNSGWLPFNRMMCTEANSIEYINQSPLAASSTEQ